MSANRDHERIEHILEYCIKVENAMKRFGRKYTDFVNDEEYRSCISFFLLQIVMTLSLKPKTLFLGDK